jgi:cytochrome c553
MSLGALAVAACGGPVSDRADAPEASYTDAASVLVMACTGCHSDQSGAIASLNTYDADQLRAALLQYKTDVSGTTVMHRLARGYSDAEIDLISAHLGRDDVSP